MPNDCIDNGRVGHAAGGSQLAAGARLCDTAAQDCFPLRENQQHAVYSKPPVASPTPRRRPV